LNNDSAEKKIADADTACRKSARPLYDPAGKIDPFEPLFKETAEIKSGSPIYAETDRKPTKALEKIDLSQLKLTGIILAGSGNRAMVQEASGRGHVISTGTFIGTHGGRVVEVLKDRVIVKEKMKDVMGRIFFQETELKLNKADI
jgi:type IV pilus assembly protein PilP